MLNKIKRSFSSLRLLKQSMTLRSKSRESSSRNAKSICDSPIRQLLSARSYKLLSTVSPIREDESDLEPASPLLQQQKRPMMKIQPKKAHKQKNIFAVQPRGGKSTAVVETTKRPIGSLLADSGMMKSRF